MDQAREIRVLINCLLLSQCSGGYRSYFENVIIPLTKKLNNENIFTKVLLPQSSLDEFGHFFEAGDIIVDRKNKKGYSRILHEYSSIPKLVGQYNFTTVYTPYQIGPVTIKGAECILMFRNMEPYVAANYPYPLRNRLRSFLLRKFSKYHLNKADKIIAVSEFTKNFIAEEENIDRDKITVVAHGIRQFVPPEHQVKGNFILTVGSIMPYKRLEDLIAAFNLFKLKRKNNTKLVIVGSGLDADYSHKIEKMILDSPFSQDISLTGKVSHKEVVEMFSECRIFVMTSEVEACPNTALEAMSMGCAIISSDNQPMPEFFKDAVLYYPYRDSVILAKHIEELMSNADNRKILGEKAILRSQLYSWEKTISKTKVLLLSQ